MTPATEFERAFVTLYGRPSNSPGWGQVKCVKTGELKSRDGEVIRVTAGTTHCAPDYWAVRAFPEYFKPADRRDVRTFRTHSRNLEHARADLERGRTTTRSAERPTRSVLSRGVLPPRPHRRVLPRKAAPWRLPR